MRINNIQYAIILLIGGLFIVLLFHSLGNDIVVNKANYLKSLYKKEYKYVKENMNMIQFENYKILYKIVDKNKPYIFHFCPVLFVERIKKLVETDVNIIHIHSTNTFVRPKSLKNQYIKVFDFCLSNLNITKDIILLGVCSFTDICLYIAHKRNNIIKSIILESIMDRHIDTINNIKSIKWIKFLSKDEYTINKNFKITKDILVINYKEELICPIKDTLNKVKKLKNDNNNIYFFIPKKYPKDKKIGHAEALLFEDYVDTIKKWIYK